MEYQECTRYYEHTITETNSRAMFETDAILITYEVFIYLLNYLTCTQLYGSYTIVIVNVMNAHNEQLYQSINQSLSD